jgi:hypothetical protein
MKKRTRVMVGIMGLAAGSALADADEQEAEQPRNGVGSLAPRALSRNGMACRDVRTHPDGLPEPSSRKPRGNLGA